MLLEVLLMFAITGQMERLDFIAMMMMIQLHVIVYITFMMQTEIEREEIQCAIKLVYLKATTMGNLIITDQNF